MWDLQPTGGPPNFNDPVSRGIGVDVITWHTTK